MIRIILLCSFLLAGLVANAQYTTPNTGVKWNLNNLVTASVAKGSVTYTGGVYFVNDSITIAANDTLQITTNETLKLENKIMIKVEGVLLVNPPDSVKITALNQTNRFHSVRFENGTKTSLLRKTIVEYGNGIRVLNANIKIDRCIVRYNDKQYQSSAINISGSKPEITNCKIYRNVAAAIGSPASGGGGCSPVIRNNWIFENVTTPANMPQINLGPGRTDTIVVSGNTVIGIAASTYNSGGIGVSNLLGGTAITTCVIKNNTVLTNRYGITFTGVNMKGFIKQNRIEGNKVNPNALTGGSGINLNGQPTLEVLVARNIIRDNLWGITVQNGANQVPGPKVNLGRVGSADTANVGMNQIYNNYNNGSSGQVWDLYNNTSDSIYAENNYWGTTNLTDIEDHIFHKDDNANHGFVDYLPLFQPVISGLTSEIAAAELNVYPNPANDLVTLQLNGMVLSPKSMLRFYNAIGQEVLVIKPAQNQSKLEVNTSELPVGFYTYRLENAGKSQTGRFVISR
jgi:hypothetical protein